MQSIHKPLFMLPDPLTIEITISRNMIFRELNISATQSCI